jgi:hypothetical protein
MSKRKNYWFKKIRGSYLPASTIGLIVYLAYVAYLLGLIGVWLKYDKSIWGIVVYVIPLSVASAIVTQNIASKHSK